MAESHGNRADKQGVDLPDWQIVRHQIPFNIFAAARNENARDRWYCIPSWQIEIDHEACRGIDIRAHKSISSVNAWDLSEATTSFNIYRGEVADCETPDEVVNAFCAMRLPKLTAERFAEAIAQARERLAQRACPCPFAEQA
jgi:hypothetical protein